MGLNPVVDESMVFKWIRIKGQVQYPLNFETYTTSDPWISRLLQKRFKMYKDDSVECSQFFCINLESSLLQIKCLDQLV